MKILFVSSECRPFAQTGGLADAVRSLADALGERGHDVKVALPGYGAERPPEARETGLTLSIPLGFGTIRAVVSETVLPGIRVYFIENRELFDRDGIYGSYRDPDFSDNPRRFALLGRGAIALCSELGWTPDIIHVHDWPSALVPLFLRQTNSPPPSVLTIHNLGHQGVFSFHDIHDLLLEPADFTASAPSRGEINFLAAGIGSADGVTTVSPTYAREISTDPALGPILKRRGPIPGILNGIDYTIWNPADDPYLPASFDRGMMEGKTVCRKHLQELCGFPADEGAVIIGMVTRLAEQKGFEMLCGSKGAALRRICSFLPVQVAILGTGEKRYETALAELEQELPNLKTFTVFDQRMAHVIEAGSDFFLMPSIYEPCGLNQMYSFRYGTVPIVRKVGGLADTVYDIACPFPWCRFGKGPGIVIDAASEYAAVHAVERAVRLKTRRPNRFKRIRRRGMSIRFTWNRAAADYERVFRAVISARASKRA